MPRSYITAIKQQQVIERANRCCEYCKSSMDYTSQPFVMEHIIPIAEDGETSLDNLALACGGCNGHKYTKVKALDPVSQTQVSLYHPRQQTWQDHFGWSADYLEIIGLTAIGRATIDALKLNRPGVINVRKLLLMAGLHPPQYGSDKINN
jgi:hypothetical protein